MHFLRLSIEENPAHRCAVERGLASGCLSASQQGARFRDLTRHESAGIASYSSGNLVVVVKSPLLVKFPCSFFWWFATCLIFAYTGNDI